MLVCLLSAGLILPPVVAPRSAEEIVRAVALRHPSIVTSEGEVVVEIGTRTETIAGKPAAIQYTRIRKDEFKFREDQVATCEGETIRAEVRFDGQAGWSSVTDMTGVQHSRDMTPQKVRENQRRKEVIAVVRPELILGNRALRLERGPDERVGGAPVFVVRVWEGKVERSALYVDRGSLRVLKAALFLSDPDGTRHVVDQEYSEFRAVKGRGAGCKVVMREDGQVVMTDTVESVELRPAKDYPDALFRKPRP